MRKANLAVRNFVTIVTIVFFAILMQANLVYADWVQYQSTYVMKEQNSIGQTVYNVYKNTNGSIKTEMQVLARGGNVYNSTTKVLLTKEAKGPEYVGIDKNYNVYVITAYSKVIKYSRGFRSNNTPYILEYNGAYGFERNYENGFVTKIYTTEGVYDLEKNKMNFVVAGTVESYPRVEKIDNSTYNYLVNAYYSYKYRWSGNGSSLYQDGTGLSFNNVKELNFSKEFVVFVNKSGEVYRLPINGNNAKLISSGFESFNKDSNNWVTSVETRKEKFRIDASNSQLYPKIEIDNRKLYYYTGDDEYYLYRLNSDGELVYKGTDSKKEDRTVANKVERAKFAEGYLVYVKEDDKVYKVKVGTTSSTYICSEFEKFKYDDGFVVEVIGDKRVEFD